MEDSEFDGYKVISALNFGAFDSEEKRNDALVEKMIEVMSFMKTDSYLGIFMGRQSYMSLINSDKYDFYEDEIFKNVSGNFCYTYDKNIQNNYILFVSTTEKAVLKIEHS